MHFQILPALPAFSGHRPAQRAWARTGLIGTMQSAIPQTVKVGHTIDVYVPYSFRTVVWVLFRLT